ncbi:hypothetical protein [Saccharopolyspora pogona]|uniref:hypothetical protein n=1 Tax=Saccharopolyspora pogona TaxID=333966 RepID=UPI0016863F6A|nr:hypothetical protein [Saccharopolyspora pogona]
MVEPDRTYCGIQHGPESSADEWEEARVLVERPGFGLAHPCGVGGVGRRLHPGRGQIELVDQGLDAVEQLVGVRLATAFASRIDQVSASPETIMATTCRHLSASSVLCDAQR